MKLLNKIKGTLCLLPMGGLMLLFVYASLDYNWETVAFAIGFFLFVILSFVLALRGIGYFFEETN